MYRTLSVSLALGLSLATVPVVHAEPPPTPKASPSDDDLDRARELFENGRQLYSDGSYEQAIAAFKQAYALSGDAILLYNIFQSYDRLAEYDLAIEYVEYYRAFAPASERDALAEKVESLQRRKLKAEADSAEDDDDDATRADETDTTEGSMTPAGASDRDAGGPTQKIMTPLAISLLAVTGVALGTGIGLGVASNNRGSDAEGMCAGDPRVCPAGAQEDIDAARNLAIGANVTFAISGAAALGTIVVIAVNAAKRKKQRDRAMARVTPVFGTRGGGLKVRF